MPDRYPAIQVFVNKQGNHGNLLNVVWNILQTTISKRSSQQSGTMSKIIDEMAAEIFYGKHILAAV